MAVDIEQRDHVRLIKMAGQASTQSFSMAFLPTIAKAIDHDGLKDAQTKAIVLTGDGRFFSAGADINAFQDSIESNTAPELIRKRSRCTSSTAPTHADLVHDAWWLPSTACRPAEGSDLPWRAMLVLVPMTPVWLPPMPAWAFHPTVARLRLLPRLVGEQRARRFFMQNEVWSGREAHEYGAIDVLVDPDSLMETAIGLATVWSSWGQHTKEATKHLLHVQTDNEFSAHLDHERTLIEAAGTTEAFKEGVAAFLEEAYTEVLTESVHLELHIQLLVSSAKAQEADNKGHNAPHEERRPAKKNHLRECQHRSAPQQQE